MVWLLEPFSKFVLFWFFSIQLLKIHILNPEITLLYQFDAVNALFKVPIICNINFWIERDLPPLNTFPKIHPIWRSHPSLSKCCFKTQKAQSLFYHLVNLYISLFCKRRQHFPKINIEAEVWLRFKGWILTKILRFKFFQHSQDKFLSTYQDIWDYKKCITYETRKGSRGGPCKSWTLSFSP